MSVVATIEVAAEDFTLGGALTLNPNIQVTLDRAVPFGSTDGQYLWARNGSLEHIEDVFRAEDGIESFSVVETVDDEALVRVEWVESFTNLLDVMAETGATILDGEGRAGTWRFRLRFDDREDLTAFYRRCTARKISIDLKSIHNTGHRSDVGAERGLTDAQRVTLQVATERGYFEVPRRITLTELAGELDVSDTAVSQRLRRGLSTLLTETFVIGDASPEER